jgi:beta-lactamase superfamily II metal-dependent hydrolase
MKILLALTLVLAFGTLGLSNACGKVADRRLDIYWIDVEGGAATLIVTPRGGSLLVDTGYPGHRDADRIVKVATRVAGLRQLDHVIITHYHVDHFGGAATLHSVLPIKHLHDNGIFEGSVDRPDQAYLDLKLERSVISPGDVILSEPSSQGIPALTVRCLGARQQAMAAASDAEPTPGCADAAPRPVDNTDNANSVVTLVTFGNFQFFDAGDLTWNLEKNLVCPTNRVGRVDVYQTTHHGMDVSNHPLVIRALAPTVAVFNNGATKGCEPQTFYTLKATPSVEAVYQMHRNLRGDGSPNTDEQHIANDTRQCEANFIQLSVDSTAATYTVHIPAKKHTRTFHTR